MQQFYINSRFFVLKKFWKNLGKILEFQAISLVGTL